MIDDDVPRLECEIRDLHAEVERLTRERNEAREQARYWSRKAGEAQGQLEASEWPGVIEGWRRRVEEAEKERDATRAALKGSRAVGGWWRRRAKEAQAQRDQAWEAICEHRGTIRRTVSELGIDPNDPLASVGSENDKRLWAVVPGLVEEGDRG